MTEHTFEARLSAFLTYSTGRPTAQAAAVQQISDDTEYDVRTDFCLRFRNAVRSDRRGTRDGAAIALAVQNAPEKKRAHFANLEARWAQVAGRWDHCTTATVAAARIVIAGLPLAVGAAFAEQHPDQALEIVWLNYAATKRYTTDDLDMIVRLLQRAYCTGEAAAHPKALITVVDLPTARVRTSVDRDLSGHDARIDALAAAMARALRASA